jgi:hypothetical protein
MPANDNWNDITDRVMEGKDSTSKWVGTDLFLYVYGLTITMCHNLFTIDHMFLEADKYAYIVLDHGPHIKKTVL